MRRGNIVLLIVTVVCLLSIALFAVYFYDSDEDQETDKYFNIYYTPEDPVENEDVLVYADISYPGQIKAYLVDFNEKGTSYSLMLKINETSYLGQFGADETGMNYDFWIVLIDDNTTIEAPLISSKHHSFTVNENIYPPILSNFKREPLHPTENDTVTYKVTMRNARHIRYDVLLHYSVRYSNGLTKNRSVDMVRISEGIVFSSTLESEPINSTITYSIAVWYKFKSLVITRSPDFQYKITS